MSTIVKTKSFIIKSIDYSESSCIVSLFSFDYGKIRVIAKGIKRKKSKLSSAAHNFNQIEATIYLKEDASLSILSDAATIRSYHTIGSETLKFGLVCLFFEIIDISIVENQPNHHLFNILESFLNEIDSAGSKFIDISLPYLYKTIKELGYEPLLDHCFTCGKDEPITYFSFSKGSILCSNCVKNEENCIQINPAIPKIIRKFLNTSIEKLHRIKLTESQSKMLLTIAIEFLQHQLECELKCAAFLKLLSI